MSSVSATSAVVTWRSSAPAIVTVGPVRFPVTRGSDGSLRADLVALSPAHRYRVRIRSGTTVRERTVTTGPIPDNTVASTAGGRFTLDGKPYFPIMAWGQCRDGYTPLIALGIDLFLGGCQWYGPDILLPELARRAYVAFPVSDAQSGIQAPGLIGWTYPDEADGFGILPAKLPDLPPASETGRIRFFTITNHFYSVSDNINSEITKAIYPAYYAKADAIGFDIYPVAKYCYSPFIGLRDVFSAQQELLLAAAPRPTYQWIETGRLEGECAGYPRITPAIARAEAWLAVAGGATGLGWFTHTWDPGDPTAAGGYKAYDVGPEISAEMVRTDAQLKELAPALTSTSINTSTDAPLASGGRIFARVRYAITVNASAETVKGSVKVAGLGTQPVNALWEGRTLISRDGAIADTWGPHAVHVYAASPTTP